MQFEHGCRSAYGPLILRVEATSSLNRFTVQVEDPRIKRTFEHATRSTLKSAQQEAVLRGHEHLERGLEPTPAGPEWICS